MTTRKTKIIISTWWQLGRATLVYLDFIFFKLIMQEHSCKIVYGEFIFFKLITWVHFCTLVFLHSIVIFVDVWKITRLNTNSNIMMTRRTKMVISLFSVCWPSCLSYDGEGDSFIFSENLVDALLLMFLFYLAKLSCLFLCGGGWRCSNSYLFNLNYISYSF